MLRIEPHSPQPPFEQLRIQLIDQIMAAELPAGTKLPAVRRLAADLGLAPNTVARTYRELESQGYVRTHGRNGTVVAPLATDDAVVQRRAGELARQYVTEMQTLGLNPQAIAAWVREALTQQGHPGTG